MENRKKIRIYAIGYNLQKHEHNLHAGNQVYEGGRDQLIEKHQ